MNVEKELKAWVARCLADAEPRKLDYPVRGTAAVLMPIVERNGRASFLLTKRTESVRTHKGQISFPGGLAEESDDSLMATALRETEEEIGLHPSEVEIVGRFHDYLAITEWLVAPFVGFMELTAQLRPNPGEVEKLLEVPLDFFVHTQPRVETRERLGRMIPIYFYDFENEVIWGLTASIIRDFVRLIYPSRVLEV